MTLSRVRTSKPKALTAKKRGRKKFITWNKTHYDDEGEMKGEILKRGWLWKKGERFHAWRQRYFILTTQQVYYFKDKNHFEEEKWAGVIPLLRSAVTEAPEREKAHCFKVCTRDRIFYLCADSDVDMEDWIARTHKAIDILKAETPYNENDDDDNDENNDYENNNNNNNNNKTSDSINRNSQAHVYGDDTMDESTDQYYYDDDDEYDEYDYEDDASSSMISPRRSISASHHHHHHRRHHRHRHPNQRHANDGTEYSPRYCDVDSDEVTDTGKGRRVPDLTEAEELDIAISATYVFMKPVQERTSEEQAYVLAMQDYGRNLEHHMDEHNCGPEFGLASGVAVFVMDEEQTTEQMKPFVEEMKKEYIQEMKYQFEMDNDKEMHDKIDEEEQIARAAASIFAKRPSERTNEEREYVLHLQRYAEELLKVEKKCGIEPQHGLASGTVNFVKEGKERSVDDTDYVMQMIRLLQQQNK